MTAERAVILPPRCAPFIMRTQVDINNESRRGEMLLARTLKLERKIIIERTFEVAPSTTLITELEQLASSCTVQIGSHRFTNVTFYASPITETSTSMGRRSSLALVQMYLAGDGGNKRDPTQVDPGLFSTGETLLQSSASTSIKELLSKSPGLVQLLNGTLSQNKRPMGQNIPKPRTIYFSLFNEGQLFIFPSDSVIEPLQRTESQSDILVRFWSSRIESPQGLMMIVREVNTKFWHCLQSWTRDPVLIFGEFSSKLDHSPNIAYREILFPCNPPCELAGENLVKQPRYPPPNGISIRNKNRLTSLTPSPSSALMSASSKKVRKDDIRMSLNRDDPFTVPLRSPNLVSNESIDEAISGLNSSPPGTGRHCGNCGCRTTPMWRRGPDGPSTLCNACGVKWKHGKLASETVLGKTNSPPPLRRRKSYGELADIIKETPEEEEEEEEVGKGIDNSLSPSSHLINTFQSCPVSSIPQAPIHPKFAPIKKRKYLATINKTVTLESILPK